MHNPSPAGRSPRETKNIVRRTWAVLRRYGFDPARFTRYLREFTDLGERTAAPLTFSVSGNTLRRYGRLVKTINGGRWDIAVHGYHHEDHGQLPLEQQRVRIGRAREVFQERRIQFEGFRCPYLRWNEETMTALGSLGFLWDSSKTVVWNVVDERQFDAERRQAYRRLLDFYQPNDADRYPALPEFERGFVEIPVSIPDDEALVERLRIFDKGRIGELWTAVVEETHKRGELFTVQLHPERITLCDTALEAALTRAREKTPPVWITSPGAIARWWHEKDGFRADVRPAGRSTFQVDLSCTDRATVLIRNLEPATADSPWFARYRTVEARRFAVRCDRRPVIGVAPGSAPALVSFLRQDGYIVEMSGERAGFGTYLDGFREFAPERKSEVIHGIESSEAPLVRFGRWPDRARSALAVTGDIDAVTVWDFVLRLLGR